MLSNVRNKFVIAILSLSLASFCSSSEAYGPPGPPEMGPGPGPHHHPYPHPHPGPAPIVRAIARLIAPPPREAMRVPPGFIRCRMVGGDFMNGMYMSSHRVCHYARHRDNIWISGHWQCVRFSEARGICKRWEWMPSRWVERIDY